MEGGGKGIHMVNAYREATSHEYYIGGVDYFNAEMQSPDIKAVAMLEGYDLFI